jgi:tripartite-type tricarboxylate transporter receptor subunit TctC
MTLPRRRFLQFTGAGAAGLLGAPAWGLDYPSHPVKLVVGLAPGGGVDLVGRMIAKLLTERLGQSFFVENRLGAGSNIATELVAHAPPDGATLLVASTPNAINASLYKDLPFDFIRDIAPVASVVQAPLVLVVTPAFPAQTVPDFIAYARAHPGDVSYASAGVGTPLHIAGEMFKQAAGVDMVHVPYKGVAPALIDVYGGQEQAIFADMTVVEQIKAGKLRALAVTTAHRTPALPDVPAMGEFLPGFEAPTWIGIAAPRQTPPEIIKVLHDTINAGLADPAVTGVVTRMGYLVSPMSVEAFGGFIARNTEVWGRVVKAAGIKAE